MKKGLSFKILLVVGIAFIAFPFLVSADYLSQQQTFYIEPSYDLSSRTKLTATLQKVSDNLYFYIDDAWWDSLTREKRNDIRISLASLAQEFNQNIYPKITEFYGGEWKPGIDDNTRITVLIHPITKGSGGYFRAADEYPKAQAPSSNEREMVYLNSDYMGTAYTKSLLAHEFMHLVTFNQKNRAYKVEEEIWLNEARSELASTIVGYDEEYDLSNLQRRVYDFLQNSTDSITEWKNRVADYGALNLFFQYLIDHYGKEILRDSLHSEKVGIPSINEALEKNGFTEDFSQIFTDWTIAVLLNNCNVGEKYCYKNENLKNLKVIPQISYLPSSGKSTLNMINTTKIWAGKWQRIIGGKDVLKLDFMAQEEAEFKIPYVIEDINGNFEIKFLTLDEEQKGTIYVPKFGTKNISLTILPLVQTKISGFDSTEEPTLGYFWQATTVKMMPEEEEELIRQLEAQIELLQAEVARLQALIQEALEGKSGACGKFNNNLYFGLTQSNEVRCLQIFLKSQGAEIYPEGLVTGNFLSLTQQAVIRFQEKYADEILLPLGLQQGTGFVGPLTRAKINSLLNH